MFGFYLRNQRQKAVNTLDDLNQVTSGTAGDAAVNMIIREGGSKAKPCLALLRAGAEKAVACNEAEKQYGIQFGLPDDLNRLLYRHPILQYPLQYFGIHPWWAELSLMRKEGEVTGLIYSVTTVGKDGAYVISNVQISSRFIRETGEPPLYRVGYELKRNLIHRLHIWISPELSIEERRRLATYNLDCLTTFHGCSEPKELNPGAWMEYSKQVR